MTLCSGRLQLLYLHSPKRESGFCCSGSSMGLKVAGQKTHSGHILNNIIYERQLSARLVLTSSTISALHSPPPHLIHHYISHSSRKNITLTSLDRRQYPAHITIMLPTTLFVYSRWYTCARGPPSRIVCLPNSSFAQNADIDHFSQHMY